MVTVNGIAGWFAATPHRGLANLKGVHAGQILPYEESEGSFRILRHDIEAEYVAHLFSELPDLKAIFLTQSGTPDLPFEGVVTPWDLVRLRQVRSRQFVVGLAEEAA